MKYKPFTLPEHILLGSATASLQIEGSDKKNSWYNWAINGGTKDGSNPIIADDHWNRVEEDVTLMQDLNLKIYRMSLEWSRIEPGEGEFDETAILHYKDEILKLKEAGIKPFVTLHHFSNPMWLENIGGWSNKEAIYYFRRFTEYVLKYLGSEVEWWCTINEPNIYLTQGYFYGDWPPGKKGDIKGFLKSAKNMITAHIACYKTIHKYRKKAGFTETLVGAAHHLRVMNPKTKSLTDKFSSWLSDRLFHKIFTEGMTKGKKLLPLGFGRFDEEYDSYSDFVGMNYYTRDIISFSFSPKNMFTKVEVRNSAEINDLGWEIYPKGLFKIAKDCYERYGKPIIVTENGTCDRNDDFRAKYIYNHLKELRNLEDHNIPVLAYCHWTLLDNFEWAEGYEARFGLYEVNYNTQERILRESGRFYGEICKMQQVTAEMIKEFL